MSSEIQSLLSLSSISTAQFTDSFFSTEVKLTKWHIVRKWSNWEPWDQIVVSQLRLLTFLTFLFILKNLKWLQARPDYSDGRNVGSRWQTDRWECQAPDFYILFYIFINIFCILYYTILIFNCRDKKRILFELRVKSACEMWEMLRSGHEQWRVWRCQEPVLHWLGNFVSRNSKRFWT